MQEIKWAFIENLHKLQDSEGLRAANKLRKSHIEYQRQIMKVRLAAQTFSSSVSKALLFAQELKVPEFDGCGGTAKFIADVDRCEIYCAHECGGDIPET